MFRKATKKDIDRISEIYDEIHDSEEAGRVTIGWIRNIYPTRKTAEIAIAAGDMFVEEIDGTVVAAARINKEQVPEYADARWTADAPDDEVMGFMRLSFRLKLRARATEWHLPISMKNMRLKTDVLISEWTPMRGTPPHAVYIKSSAIPRFR